jgi:hypothetical protein
VQEYARQDDALLHVTPNEGDIAERDAHVHPTDGAATGALADVRHALRHLFLELQDNTLRVRAVEVSSFAAVYADFSGRLVRNGEHCDIQEFFLRLFHKLTAHLDVCSVPTFVKPLF